MEKTIYVKFILITNNISVAYNVYYQYFDIFSKLYTCVWRSYINFQILEMTIDNIMKNVIYYLH